MYSLGTLEQRRFEVAKQVRRAVAQLVICQTEENQVLSLINPPVKTTVNWPKSPTKEAM